MNILCDLFGHRKIGEGWWGDGLYGDVRPSGVDGTGRSHYRIVIECQRCHELFTIARFHGSQVDLPEKPDPEPLAASYIIDAEPVFNWNNTDGAARNAFCRAHRNWQLRQERLDPKPVYIEYASDKSLFDRLSLVDRQAWFDYCVSEVDRFDNDPHRDTYDSTSVFHNWSPPKTLSEFIEDRDRGLCA